MESSKFPLQPRLVKGSIREIPQELPEEETVVVRVVKNISPEPKGVAFDKAKRPAANVVTLKRVRRSSSRRSGKKKNAPSEGRSGNSRSSRRRAIRFDVTVCLAALCIFGVTFIFLQIQSKKFVRNGEGTTFGNVPTDLYKEPRQNADEVIQSKLAEAKVGAQKEGMPDPSATQSSNATEEKSLAEEEPGDPLGRSWAPGAAPVRPVPAAKTVTIPIKKFDLNTPPSPP